MQTPTDDEAQHRHIMTKCLRYWGEYFNYRFIFVAVPKTASTTISRLAVRSPTEKGYRLVGNRTHFNLNEYRSGLHRLKGSVEGEKLYQAAYKFGFVRNPWCRAVSLYENRKGRHQCSTFEKFVDMYDGATFCQVNPSYHRFQLDWFRCPKTGTVMSDYIGRYENLERDTDNIFDKMKLKRYSDKLGTYHGDVAGGKASPFGEVPRKTKSIPYQEYYTPQTQQIMLEKCIEDIKYFNYTFE